MQLLETTLLNLVNFPSLVATNAARMRRAAGADKRLLEFGLRRAQGPDGGFCASKYAYMGGFDGTSNVLAGKLTGISVSGTHAHAFVQSYASLEDIKDPMLNGHNLLDMALEIRSRKPEWANTNESELAAFVAYALSFPKSFLALVDTYDTLQSGVPNFIIVSLALAQAGFDCAGIRLDSGDLSYLSLRARELMDAAAEEFSCPVLAKTTIVASNDIDESILLSLRDQSHAIDAFGIGTKLVTCSSHPALGCVFKLAQIRGVPRIKLSQEVEKVSTRTPRRSSRTLWSLPLYLQKSSCMRTEGRRSCCVCCIS